MSLELHLKAQTEQAWLDQVMQNFERFLQDHALCEKKASSMAMSMVAHYPDRPKLVTLMVDLAIEELMHYKEVLKLIYAKQQILQTETKDDYVNQLRQSMLNKSSEAYLLDRLLIAAILEARGAERFGMVADGLSQASKPEAVFYQALTRSESRHYQLFLDLACEYYSQDQIVSRLETLLLVEAEIISSLPHRGTLH